jgi:hypothetical protein
MELPVTSEKNTHIIVFIDLFTKYAEAFVISKIDAETKWRYMFKK